MNVVISPGARVATDAGVIGPNWPDPVNAPSVTEMFVSVVFPVLVTTNEYVSSWPTS